MEATTILTRRDRERRIDATSDLGETMQRDPDKRKTRHGRQVA